MRNLKDYRLNRVKQMNCIREKQFLENTAINTVLRRTEFLLIQIVVSYSSKAGEVGDLHVEDWNGSEGRHDN